MSVYKQKLSAASFVRKSRLIVGLDFVADITSMKENPSGEKDRLEKQAREIIEATRDYAIAYKFNRQLVLPLGVFDRIPDIVDSIHEEGLTAIMDCKINDIGNTNAHIARYYFSAGFDALIVNPLIGWEGGLDTVFDIAQTEDKGIIILGFMSHPASDEGYGLDVVVEEEDHSILRKQKHEPLYLQFARKARKWESDGMIVGATFPEKISEIRKVLGPDIPIISPGVGAQGADPKEAINAGASYIIVSRAIINADNPKSIAADIAEQTF
jgi:orotidine-5'-phosphate decarboxylase